MAKIGNFRKKFIVTKKNFLEHNCIGDGLTLGPVVTYKCCNAMKISYLFRSTAFSRSCRGQKMILSDKVDLLHVEKVHLARERCNKSVQKKRQREGTTNLTKILQKKT